MSPRSLLAFLPLVLLSLACSSGDSDSEIPSGTSGQGGAAGKGGASAGNGGSAGSSAGSGGAAGSSAAGSGQAGTNQGGAGTGSAGSGGASAGSAGTGGKIPCETTNDCVAFIPETKPAGCAKALCDADQKFCRFVAKDLDGDGDPSNSCKSNDATISIELGGDCDEGDDKVNSQAWDGPEGLAGGEAKPGRCEGLDNDCNGVADDGKLDSGESCKCEPGQVRQCSQDSGGKAIVWPSGAPVGECKYGKQTCDDAGKWGACTGAVPPADEICDAIDNDCDGQTDEDDALNKKKWYWDADGDLHGDKTFAAVVACNAPNAPPEGCVASKTTSCTVGPESWKNTILQDDCNDTDATTNPEAKEVCDGADNDCDGDTDEGATNIVTWYRDDDGDGFLLDSKKGQPLSLTQCTPPGSKPEECPEGKAPCANLWLKEGTTAFTDCNDLNADVFPGAWDGPAFQPRPYGIVAPGLKAEFFKIAGYPALPDFSALQPESVTRTDVTLNHNFGQGSIGEGLPKDIGARWTGSIVVPEDGEYTFYPQTDDGVRLWVGDLQTPIINDWTSHAPTENIAKLQLFKGTYPLKLEWFDHHAGGVIILRWEGPGFSKQPMTVALEPTAAQQINRCGDGLDNNCDGTVDNGVIQTKGNGSVLAVGCNAECDPVDPDPTKNVTKLCGNSPEGVGICHKGSQYCRPSGTWSACEGESQPKPRDCTSALDNNCDGKADNELDGECGCSPVGKTEDFDGHSQDGVGVCRPGKRVCIQNGGKTIWQVTQTPVGPTAERCQVQQDYDCNGIIGDASCLKLVYESNFNWSQNGCSNLPTEAYPALDAPPPGYGHWAAFRVWTNPENTNGMAPVYRCYCPSRGYSTTAIGVQCNSIEVGCSGPGDVQDLLGYVATNNNNYEPIKRINLSSGAVGYCAGDSSGCIYANVCIGSSSTNFYSR